jgi:hypothetical protein
MKLLPKLLVMLLGITIGVLLPSCSIAGQGSAVPTEIGNTLATAPLPTNRASYTATVPPQLPATDTARTTASLTSTSQPMGQLLNDVLIEVKTVPGVECGPSELWLASSPYQELQPFLQGSGQSYRSPRWSNVGRRVAYIQEADGLTGVVIAESDGTNPSSQGPTFPYGPVGEFCNHLSLSTWSPSDHWLAFEYTNYADKFYKHLYLLNGFTGEASRVDEYSYGLPLPAWSLSEDVLAYVAATYDEPGYHLRQVSVKLLQVSDGAITAIDLSVPEDFDIEDRRDQIRGLAWQSDSQLLVSISPTIGDDPGQLYRVDTVTQVWELLAEFGRNLTTENHPPSTLAVSTDGQFVCWAGTDLVILDTATWQEHSRLQTNWLGHPIVEWNDDSNGLPVLVYNNKAEFWLYEPQTGANVPLIAGEVLSRYEGFVLENADWKP